MTRRLSRRQFVYSTSVTAVGLAASRWAGNVFAATNPQPLLQEFGYGDVTIHSESHNRQLENTHSVLMGMSDDSLLKPFRMMAGQPAPGEELGGWYQYLPTYDWHTGDAGFAPGATYGQWVSALARAYAINKDEKVREKVLRLNQLYAKAISTEFFSDKNRFPAYDYDKLLLGLMDSHRLLNDPDAYRILDLTTKTATPQLPGKAIENRTSWRPGKDDSFTWDESYTMPENLFLAYQRGAGQRYRDMAVQYLDDYYFGPLSEGHSNFAGRHAYSHVNALSSAMQAYLTLGSEKHLRAAKNGFDFLAAQSFATGGWGPDEQLRGPGSDDIATSLTKTHNSFETPCGAHGHFKLTRYLLRVTRDARYGDSMERVMYNTVLGSKPLMPDGRAFYYSDYNFKGRKVYSNHGWPCCSGTLPQVATDYGINAYLRDTRGIYVNLYIPSSVRWAQEGAQVSLTQKSSYPFDSQLSFEVQVSRPVEFSTHFRIPAWAEGASISVNGKRTSDAVVPGTFAMINRTWKNDDRVEIELPLKNRIEALDARHPDTVALLCGPLVLFAVGEDAPKITRSQLLGARKTGQETWQAETSTGSIKMLPFTGINDEPYTTYMVIG